MQPHSSSIDPFINSGIFLDLEVNPKLETIKQLGATMGNRTLVKTSSSLTNCLATLDEWALSAGFFIGHHLVDHDSKIIAKIAPESRLLQLPIIDTLILSTLVFPKQPFQALTKSYKISDDERNNPLMDCKDTATLFRACLEKLILLKETDPERIALYATLLGVCRNQHEDRTPRTPTPSIGLRIRQGFSLIFEAIGQAQLGETEINPTWHSVTAGSVCKKFSDHVLDAALKPDDLPPIPTAFSLAWLSENNPTFPPWALFRYRETIDQLKLMRATDCQSKDCQYCQNVHSPDRRLHEFFGYPAFRNTPEVKDQPGKSLQREIVRHGMADKPLLGILPTGGGKSLCFQIPALHRHRTRGSLTIVISPLQSLMKDQVVNLGQRFNIKSAAALYSGISAPERQLLLNEIADGSLAIVYIAPEQLRNPRIKKILSLRDIGAWVFDEAHCLAKWGHDFRPDYTYVARVIQEIAKKQSVPVPPVQAYTATAKADVRDAIIDHFQKELGQDLTLFDGGAERNNLHYSVETIPEERKQERILELLNDHLASPNHGAAIIFCSTRKHTEQIADFINHNGFTCGSFHAGIEDRETKEKIQEDFMDGKYQVMAATNAFGMGVDKENVRLVIHHRMPNSLENYLQEAGRAGRDNLPAKAILLHDPNHDADWQLDRLHARKLSKRDIDSILRTIRNRAKKTGNADTSVLSAREIADSLRPISNDPNSGLDETAIKAGIAHLERCELLVRDDNINRVLSIRRLCKSLPEAIDIIDKRSLSAQEKSLWRAVMKVLFDPTITQPNILLDTLCSLVEMNTLYQIAKKEANKDINEQKIIIELLTSMSGPEIGLFERDVCFSAVVRTANNHNPVYHWKKWCSIENHLLELLSETCPDVSGQHHVDLDGLSTKISSDVGYEVNHHQIRKLLESWPKDLKQYQRIGKGLGFSNIGTQGILSFDPHLTWQPIKDAIKIRQFIGNVIAQHLLTLAKSQSSSLSSSPAISPPEPDSQSSLIEFKDSVIAQILNDDLFYATNGLQKKQTTNTILHTLVLLDKFHCIELVHGKAIITSAMTLKIPSGSRKRSYSSGDHAPQEAHHSELVFQVHVIEAYAKTFATSASKAYDMLLRYFILTKAAFVSQYFSNNEKQVNLACTLDSYLKITKGLSATQSSIVCSQTNHNTMILAGPGSGKTRVIVHRVAFLLKVTRILPEKIAIVCYNRNAAMELRKRLFALVGPLSSKVIIGTYHSLALRITDRRIDPDATRNDNIFNEIIRDATAMLQGKNTPIGEDEAEFLLRLQTGFSSIFVDEYQDINGDAYEMIAALAGKSSPNTTTETCLTAVGDDDQSIYSFQKANVAYIRQFEIDYNAKRRELLENFRSSQAIIDGSNHLITGATDRMKSDPIMINHARRNQPYGGSFEAIDLLGNGRIQVISTQSTSRYALAYLAIDELRRIRKYAPDAPRSEFAILTRTHDSLTPVRDLAEKRKIPICYRVGRHPYDFRTERNCAKLREILAASPNELFNLQQLSCSMAAVGTDATDAASALLEELICKIDADHHTMDHAHSVSASTILRHLDDGLRDINVGFRHVDGVTLSTCHSAKGLEFDHVILLDHPRWNSTDAETRRLFYVAMTRARVSLSIITHANTPSRLVNELLEHPNILQRKLPDTPPDPCPSFYYDTLGLDDLVISYLGWISPEKSNHQQIKNLRPNDPIHLEISSNGKIHITVHNTKIARLSEKGANRFRSLIENQQIHRAHILAIVQRTKQQQITYPSQKTILCDDWEIPIIEIISTHPANKAPNNRNQNFPENQPFT